MSFPLRTSRSDFGPEPRNRRPVVDPETEMGAEIGRLLFWQTSGAGLTTAMAWLRSDGAAVPLILGRAEAWNPRGETTGANAPPVVARTAAGLYTVTYATTYPDHAGVARTLNLAWGAAFPQSSGDRSGVAFVTAPNVAAVEMRLAGALTDMPFALAVW
jgi:hypothetical protein